MRTININLVYNTRDSTAQNSLKSTLYSLRL